MFDVMRLAIGYAVWAGVCSWAMARGTTPERIGGAVRMLSAVITPFVQYNGGLKHAELGVFAVDLAVLLAFIWIALRWDRWWAIFCSAFLVCQAATHVARMFNLEVSQFYYLTASVAWSYMALWAQAFGVGQIEWRRWREWRARRAAAAA